MGVYLGSSDARRQLAGPPEAMNKMARSVYLVRLRITHYYLQAASRIDGPVGSYHAAYVVRLRTGSGIRSIED